MADNCAVVGVVDMEEVAFEAAEAKYDVCQFFGREAVDGAVAAGIVADDGEVFCGGPGMAAGETGCRLRVSGGLIGADRLRCGLVGATGLGLAGEVGKD